MTTKLFDDWLENVSSKATDVPLFQERSGARPVGLAALKKLLADHFVGEEVVLKMGGYAKAAAILKNSLPTNKRTRSRRRPMESERRRQFALERRPALWRPTISSPEALRSPPQ